MNSDSIKKKKNSTDTAFKRSKKEGPEHRNNQEGPPTPPPPVSSSSMKEIRTYAYQNNDGIEIREFEIINHIECLLLIQFDEQKIPITAMGDITMRQMDEETNKTYTVSFKRISARVNSDKSFQFIFQENPLPPANELDAQNPRMLSISISGIADDQEIKGQLAWRDINGRPRTIPIKMSMIKK